ncbi:AIR synthase-related protein, partial [Mycobacterium sp.]|uniref:AIR synthase-related protein n=1 Tax=Mycobacterium sp. TaxID=1785 RepID=UPI00127C3B32
GVVLHEERLPVHPMVTGACELLGIDPLYVANEGKIVAVVPAEEAQAGLAAWRSHPLGAEAAQIGVIVEEPAQTVVMR